MTCFCERPSCAWVLLAPVPADQHSDRCSRDKRVPRGFVWTSREVVVGWWAATVMDIHGGGSRRATSGDCGRGQSEQGEASHLHQGTTASHRERRSPPRSGTASQATPPTPKPAPSAHPLSAAPGATVPGASRQLDGPLLRPEQAAELLSVKTSWVYDAVRTGRLPCLRVGRHIRFTRAMLEEWLSGR